MTDAEFKILFDKHYSKMMYLAIKGLGNIGACKELVLDTFMMYYNKGYDIEHTLYTILRRKIISYKKSAARKVGLMTYQVIEGDDFDDELGFYREIGEEYNFDFDNEMLEANFIQKMYDNISALSEKDQMYIRELFFNKKSSAQLARELNIPCATVRSEKRAVIERLRVVLFGKKRQQKLPSSRKP